MFEHDEKDGSYHYRTVFLCLVKVNHYDLHVSACIQLYDQFLFCFNSIICPFRKGQRDSNYNSKPSECSRQAAQHTYSYTILYSIHSGIFNLSLSLSYYLFNHLLISLSIYLFIYLLIYLSIYLLIH